MSESLVYHYYGFCRKSEIEEIHFDGVIVVEKRIKTVDDFKNIKSVIAETVGLDVDKISISSLSVVS
jgi:hypothetical protein